MHPARLLALDLSRLRGALRTSGLRPALKEEADGTLSRAISHLMAETAPPPAPDPAQMEIGLAAPEGADPRPYWNRD